MDKKECLNLFGQYFQVQSCIVALKNPDFELKSHIFFFKDIFKEIDEIKILKVSSKNTQDNIIFDVYYVSHEFEGLYHGYFRIKPESENACKMFDDISKMCTDLSEYIYYVYQNSELLKIYLISGSIQNALEQCVGKGYANELKQLKKRIYTEIADNSGDEFCEAVLDRHLNSKYIFNFITFNSKCSEPVKMFLLNILSDTYSSYICMLNRVSRIENHICVSPDSLFFNGNDKLPVYGLLDHAALEKFVVFLKFDFDFEGGVNIGKTTGQR
jgi:hypothetical protein